MSEPAPRHTPGPAPRAEVAAEKQIGVKCAPSELDLIDYHRGDLPRATFIRRRALLGLAAVPVGGSDAR